jgi:predicted TIM-barrel fold metal-dependent hydrolase
MIARMADSHVAESVIDFHTHVQPHAAAGVAFQQQFGFADPPRNGTPEELLPMMDDAGVRRVLMVPWMPAQDLVDARLAGGPTNARHREEIRRQVVCEWFELNRWAVETVAKHPDRMSCLVGLDPILMTADEVASEVEDKLSRGACGLKIAPLFLRAGPDDPRVAIVFEQAARHGVFVLSQAGAHGYGDQPDWGNPERFEAVLRTWPTVDVQLAHLGLGGEAEVARLTARYSNLFTDTSARLHDIGQPGAWSLAEAADWFRRIGIDRVLFGTNYPMHAPAQFLQVIRDMPLDDSEREQVLWRNATGILERAATGGREVDDCRGTP